MGAFLLLSADLRIGADIDTRIQVNKVQIGLTLPRFAIEVCRQRLTPAHLNIATVMAQPYLPQQAIFGNRRPPPCVWQFSKTWPAGRHDFAARPDGPDRAPACSAAAITGTQEKRAAKARVSWMCGGEEEDRKTLAKRCVT